MRVALVVASDGGGLLCPLTEDGEAAGAVERVPDAVAAVREREHTERPRWVWASTAETYQKLLAGGVRVDRCHDVELTEALLLGHAGRWGEPRGLAAALARLRGWPVPKDPPPRTKQLQPMLFDTGEAALPGGVDPMAALVEVHADQQRRIAGVALPGRFRLLVAAESAGALVATEMGGTGLPWRADVHDALLVEMLGPRSAVGAPPRRLGELAERISQAFGDHRLHPDSPAEVLRAFAKAGFKLSSTRSWVLREVDHPAVPLLLEYKELYRIHVAHGWSWLASWVHGGRFRPEYVPGGVVSGRWATRGGGALQIPRKVRGAVIADAGWKLVVADASQLEPRVLAAMAGDHRLAAAAGDGDLYAALAADAFEGDRARAKLGMLGALYGQTSGGIGPLLATLRQRFPAAMGYVEHAAQLGESGALVRSHLGRTCPPASVSVALEGSEPAFAVAEGAAEERKALTAARARGRFTRNFVVQATAAEWALAMLASLRATLHDMGRADLVFFQHDEVIVHCAAENAEKVVVAVHDAAVTATRLLFGDTPVRFPLEAKVVDCYADAK
ncbi:bifunctional 3'-5' exonuclease/DNA polymerase [Allokutzneria oryzae]|uniref:DNA-directed DNA polymerase n=1 Tax=Allokutzneria oryzae TaxID=1378989 RepID=A0ABV6A8Q1_9PSEU